MKPIFTTIGLMALGGAGFGAVIAGVKGAIIGATVVGIITGIVAPPLINTATAALKQTP